MPDPVRIDASDTLRKLKSIEELRGARRGLEAGAHHIKGTIDEYPPATIANSESNPGGRWYQRGYGPRWRRRDGSIGGRKTSETLGKKWTTRARNAGLTQVVGNNVSYGPYVQSEEKQTRFHQQRGWKTDVQVAREEGPRVLEFVKNEIEKELRKS